MKPDEIYCKYKNTYNIKEMFDDNYNLSIVQKYLDEYSNIKNMFLNGTSNEHIDNLRIYLKYIDISKIHDFININKMKNPDDLNYQISHINELIKNKKFGI